LVKIPSSDEIDKALADLKRWQQLRMKRRHEDSDEFRDLTVKVEGSALSFVLSQDQGLRSIIRPSREGLEYIHDIGVSLVCLTAFCLITAGLWVTLPGLGFSYLWFIDVAATAIVVFLIFFVFILLVFKLRDLP
jgi:hypothetical protein